MGLFDSRKEQKSIKLVKKLQEQADLEWDKELKRRREQELNDEAIAKELQAQLQDESNNTSTNTATTTPTIRLTNITENNSRATPPPLPVKPRAYNNSSISLASVASNSNSTGSVPTSQSFSSLLPKPLYGLESSSSQPSLPPRQQNMSAPPSQKPVKSYLPSQTYKPELQFSLTSPVPAANSVFYTKTPSLASAKPTVTVQPQNNTSSATPVMRPTTSAPTPKIHMSMPEPIDTTPSNYTSTYTTTTPPAYNDPIVLPLHQRASSPTIPVASNFHSKNHSYPNYQRQNSTPISLPLDVDNNTSYVHQQVHNNTPPAQQSYNNTLPPQQSYNNNSNSIEQSYTTTPPAQQSYNTIPSVQQNYNNIPQQQNYKTPPSYNTQQSYNNTPPSQPPVYVAPVKSTNYANSPPAQYSSVSSQSIPTHSATLVSTPMSMPSNREQSSSVPLTTPSASTNPYFTKNQPPKPIFSNSVLSLKPDEEAQEEREEDNDEWDSMIPLEKRRATPPPPAVSDDESEYDYSDMVYQRKDDVMETESDPFADSFAVQIPKHVEPTATTLDAALLKRQLSTNKTAVEEHDKKQINETSDRIYEEKKSEEEESSTRTYVEKESEEIEPVFPRFQTPIQHTIHAFSVENTPATVYQNPPGFFNNEEEENTMVYPTNILRAGAPPSLSPNNPYNKKQMAVPVSEYGYYKENEQVKGKSLPKLPESTAQEDRHITVASVNPEQRVWIRIHPTDTGKMLAERIHIVASYQTRRVTKITTKNGRNIPLDNSPLFDDWDEIINFKEGESWAVEWVPVESPYVDIITEGKEFMKLLKANFKGSSSHKD